MDEDYIVVRRTLDVVRGIFFKAGALSFAIGGIYNVIVDPNPGNWIYCLCAIFFLIAIDADLTLQFIRWIALHKWEP